jgi:hypothetical protein
MSRSGSRVSYKLPPVTCGESKIMPPVIACLGACGRGLDLFAADERKDHKRDGIFFVLRPNCSMRKRDCIFDPISGVSHVEKKTRACSFRPARIGGVRDLRMQSPWMSFC